MSARIHKLPVGLYEQEACDRSLTVDTYVRDFKEVDRAVLDGEEEGFAKILVTKGREEILGATIVARHAGEMIRDPAGSGVEEVDGTLAQLAAALLALFVLT